MLIDLATPQAAIALLYLYDWVYLPTVVFSFK